MFDDNGSDRKSLFSGGFPYFVQRMIHKQKGLLKNYFPIDFFSAYVFIDILLYFLFHCLKKSLKLR